MTSVETDAQDDARATVQPAKSTKATLITLARRVLVLAVVVAAGYQLVTHWDDVWTTLSGIAWQSALLSQVAVIVSIVFGVLGWQTLIDDLGKPIGVVRGAQINLVGALGKYVPGSLWAYVLQMELGKKAGLARARIFTSALVQVGISIVVSLLLGAFVMPVIFDQTPQAMWLFVLLPIGLIALHPRILTWGTSLVLKVLRKPPLDHRLKWTTIGKVFGYAVVGFGFQGVHLWLLANSVGAPGVKGLLLCVGAMALAMTIGLFFFIMPAGAGAREVVMGAVLVASGIDPIQAAAFAVASRAMFIVADVITAGTAALMARGRNNVESEAVDA